MFFRTLLFFLVIYLLIKLISRLFLPNRTHRKKGGFFNQDHQHSTNNRRQSSRSERFDEIEEAEFEDITEDEKTTSKRTD